MTETKEVKAVDKKEHDDVPSEIVKKVKSSANYCYNCNRCVNVCPLAHLGVFFPRNLINDLIFLSIEEALKNTNIWECLSCGQCTAYCPMTQKNVGVRIPELILELRKFAVDHQINGVRIGRSETHDGIFPLISRIMAQTPLPPKKLDFLKDSSLKTATSGEIAYFVGCAPLMNDIFYNFKIDYTNTAKTIIGILNEANIVPVVLNEKCCGHDIVWSKGDLKTFKKLAEYNVKIYREAGVKKIILGCAEGYRTWKYDYPKTIKNCDFEVLHFSEFFLKEKILEKIIFPRGFNFKVTYHDACRLGRMGGKLYDAPRELIKQLPGVELIEMQNIKDDALCCGVSAFACCNEYTRLLRQMRIEEAANTGAEYLIVPCPKCLIHFTCYLNEPGLDEKQKQLKNKIKVIDLASFIGKLLYIA